MDEQTIEAAIQKLWVENIIRCLPMHIPRMLKLLQSTKMNKIPLFEFVLYAENTFPKGNWDT